MLYTRRRPATPLLLSALVLLAAAGWMIERDRSALAQNLRRVGYLGMLAAGLLLAGAGAWCAAAGLCHRKARRPPEESFGRCAGPRKLVTRRTR